MELKGLKEMRESRNWTLKEVAEKIGVSHVTVLKWEKGVHVPNSKYLAKLADLFGCSADDILRFYLRFYR